MKRSYLLVLTGGVLAAVAFFLPFLVSPRAGLFGPGDSMLSMLQATLRLLNEESVSLFQAIMTILFFVFEPITALLLVVSGLLAPRLGRSLYVWGLSGAVPTLTFLLWLFSLLYAGFLARPGTSVLDVIPYFGIGYWLAIIGCALGLLGAVLGWLSGAPRMETPMQPLAGSARGRAPLNMAGIALELCACLLLIVGLFLPSFLVTQPLSMVNLLTMPDDFYILWPALLDIALLLAGGLLAFTGRKGAHLVSLSGALIGLILVLAFLVRLFPGFNGALFEIHAGLTFWVTVVGCLVGFVGAVLGLLARPAAPTPAAALATPVPF